MFRADNTEGYTAPQLDALNHRLWYACLGFTDEQKANRTLMHDTAADVQSVYDDGVEDVERDGLAYRIERDTDAEYSLYVYDYPEVNRHQMTLLSDGLSYADARGMIADHVEANA